MRMRMKENKRRWGRLSKFSEKRKGMAMRSVTEKKNNNNLMIILCDTKKEREKRRNLVGSIQ
jgi:hypothetical protein